MNIDIFPELDYFLSSFLIGIIFLFCYDIFRILRRIVKHAWLFVALEDIIFWAAAGITAFRTVYEKNFGIIRAYAFIAMVLGMYLYYTWISGHYVRGVTRFLKRTGHLIYKFFYKISYPIRFIALRMKKLFNKVKAKYLKKVEKEKEKRRQLREEQQRIEEEKNKEKLAQKAERQREKDKKKAAGKKVKKAQQETSVSAEENAISEAASNKQVFELIKK